MKFPKRRRERGKTLEIEERGEVELGWLCPFRLVVRG